MMIICTTLLQEITVEEVKSFNDTTEIFIIKRVIMQQQESAHNTDLDRVPYKRRISMNHKEKAKKH